MAIIMRGLAAARRRAFVHASFVAVAAMLFATPARAESPQLYKVEEDWELVVNEPDPDTNSPQITFFTCPDATDPDCYFQLQMNYAADEWFSSGGFHVAAVRNEQLLDEARSETQRVISVNNDHIRWTSVMASISGELLFAVKDGHGDDWGSFGGPDYLVRMPDGGVSSLEEYTPASSLELVDIGFGGNRVASITLRSVRFYYTDGSSSSVTVNQSP